MPPELHFDLNSIDQSRVLVDREGIRRVNPQRFEMEHIDGILHLDREAGVAVGFKDVRDDEFWVRGHMPGMPLLPGVIMCEAAAQLGSYYAMSGGMLGPNSILGLGGLEDVRFRGPVRPGDRLILVAKTVRLKPRQSVFDVQGFVKDSMVFHAQVIGIRLDSPIGG